MALIIVASNLVPSLERKDGTADYEVEVSVNREFFIWRGKIENHVRKEGAEKLLRVIADEIEKANA